jgi:hypothetical protein
MESNRIQMRKLKKVIESASMEILVYTKLMIENEMQKRYETEYLKDE